MNIHFFIGVAFILGGIGLIASTFYVQRQEDKERMPGFYTTATICAIKEHKSKTDVTFEFTKDFKVIQVKDTYPAGEAAGWVVGRRALIVYDEGQGRIYYNPMKEYRKRQLILTIAGFMVLMFGISWVMFSATL